MAYRIAGTYVAACDCQLLCPCPYDGPPTGANGECKGLLVFDVANGSLEDTDLSGVAFALWNRFPSNLSAGTGPLASSLTREPRMSRPRRSSASCRARRADPSASSLR